ncbi:amidohydrolase domain containing protein [Colletotrichum kahawae]|uniref:Amidohydrolase domain containing protein n=1 Tax=Colletotrichum kahawae TaxID=34407 RepID=A0AAE0D337_COLKA|nr:amidohydrolase domain containing protein [Colletotrichum kahawae]
MSSESSSFTVHTSLLFDSKTKSFVKNTSIVVNRTQGIIDDVYRRKDDEEISINKADIDLRGKVVMPGFVDAHAHVFLHPYDEASLTVQERDESIVERVVRATNHLRLALLSGFTTYRDLGTEGMRSFDANLRDCVNRGLLPGPRLFVATECLASTGSYEVRHENVMATMPRIADVCDGPADVRRAVRRRVGDGADVIKFYADYRRKVMRQEEMDAIVEEARLADLPVAAHTTVTKSALMAIKAGVDTIEHCNEGNDQVLREMRRQGTIYVPTLSVVKKSAAPYFEDCLKRVKKAYDLGVRLAVGGDTGGPMPHGEGSLEMELMMRAGVPLVDVLEACMVGGWESCGKEKSGFLFGAISKGYRADIIALAADPREDAGALRKVDFVMKDGRVWKKDGHPIGFVEEPPSVTPHPAADDSDWVHV